VRRRTFLRGALAVLVGAATAPIKTIDKVVKVPFKRVRPPIDQAYMDYYFPIIRAHYPNMIADKIVSVQPMPTGSWPNVLYLDDRSWWSRVKRWWRAA